MRDDWNCSEERTMLHHWIAHGKGAAKKLTHARMLLHAEQSAAGTAWPDDQMRAALHVSRRTIERVRQALVEAGHDAARPRKQPA